MSELNKNDKRIVDAYNYSQEVLMPILEEEVKRQGIPYTLIYDQSYLTYCGKSPYNQTSIRFKNCKKSIMSNSVDISTLLNESLFDKSKYYVNYWKYDGEHYFVRENYATAQDILDNLEYIVAKAKEFILDIPMPENLRKQEKKQIEDLIKEKPMNYQVNIFDLL